tara:strand:+ start:613 stop:1272 length:660 start_codon:yes stop_codon:yes gene_type:complete
MRGMNRNSQTGAANIWLIMTIVLSVTTIIAAGFLVWALMNYFDQKDNVDSKVSIAVAEAVKEQADKDAAYFEQEEKKPNREFVGPDEYGRLMFDYPKTWSVYVEDDASDGGEFTAYLNPVSVPPVSSDTQMALRVTIETRKYEDVVDRYQSKVRTGDLRSSPVEFDGQAGVRLDGLFTRDIRGSAVVFPIRDKVVTLRTDADTFGEDFDAIIGSVSFNK